MSRDLHPRELSRSRAVVAAVAVSATLAAFAAGPALASGDGAAASEHAGSGGLRASAPLISATRASANATQIAVGRAAEAVLAAGAPGVLVQVRERGAGGTRAWTVRRGVADVRRRTPIDPAASFRIASVTKTYLATAVLAAVGDGRIGLDDSLGRWLPSILPKLDEGAITVRMLLDHTSGVADPTPYLLRRQQLFRGGPVTPASLVAATATLRPVAAPGARFSYSNANYWLLAMILERAEGHPYTAAIERRILRPLELRRTLVPRDTTRLPAPFLHGYAPRPGHRFTDLTASFNASWGSASGGMVATVGDLNRFSAALLSGRLLAPAQLAAMKEGVAVPPNPMGIEAYGLGLTRMRLDCGTTLYGNIGGQSGYTTWMQSTADGRRQIAVVVNVEESAGVDGAIRGLVEAAFC
jgi:D-alanyl-D-alanine carboxypeptidase